MLCCSRTTPSPSKPPHAAPRLSASVGHCAASSCYSSTGRSNIASKRCDAACTPLLCTPALHPCSAPLLCTPPLHPSSAPLLCTPSARALRSDPSRAGCDASRAGPPGLWPGLWPGRWPGLWPGLWREPAGHASRPPLTGRRTGRCPAPPSRRGCSPPRRAASHTCATCGLGLGCGLGARVVRVRVRALGCGCGWRL